MDDLVIVKDFIIDLKYSTSDNFMNTILYDSNECYLRKGTYNKLLKAKEFFKKYNLQIKIWDGYRPLKVQQYMWDKIHDERYVSNPNKKCYHPTGGAVDVTLCDSNGVELLMPSKFDDFSEKASRNYYESLSDDVKRNVMLLDSGMIYAGFVPLESEWWHFNDSDNYEIIDI